MCFHLVSSIVPQTRTTRWIIISPPVREREREIRAQISGREGKRIISIFGLGRVKKDFRFVCHDCHARVSTMNHELRVTSYELRFTSLAYWSPELSRGIAFHGVVAKFLF